MKEFLKNLLCKSYFYRHEGRNGAKSVSGSGMVTVRRWVPVHETMRSAHANIVQSLKDEGNIEDFKPWFNEFRRIK